MTKDKILLRGDIGQVCTYLTAAFHFIRFLGELRLYGFMEVNVQLKCR